MSLYVLLHPCTKKSDHYRKYIGKYHFSDFRYFLDFWFFMAVLDPGRVSIGFPEAVRSFLAEQCPKQSYGGPIQLQNHMFWDFVCFVLRMSCLQGPFCESEFLDLNWIIGSEMKYWLWIELSALNWNLGFELNSWLWTEFLVFELNYSHWTEL